MKSGSGMLHAGLSRKNPAGVDSSMGCKGGSVNANPTRSKVAPNPKSLGPRTA